MPSSALSQRLLLPDEIPVHVYCPSYDLTQQELEQSRLNFAIAAKKRDNAKSETKAKINISCVNCDVEENKDWQGRITGKGITGLSSAILTKIKHKNKLLKRNTLLMKLLTICYNCCIELDWDGSPDQGQILGVGNINKIAASLVLGLSYKEVEIVASSKEIIIGGAAMNTIKTVSIDGERKEWFLLNKSHL